MSEEYLVLDEDDLKEAFARKYGVKAKNVHIESITSAKWGLSVDAVVKKHHIFGGKKHDS